MTSSDSQTIPTELLDEVLQDYQSPQDWLGEHGLLKALTKRLAERALEAEMSAHLGYERHAQAGRGSGNSRNGKTRKRVQSEAGQFELEVPRDRDASFEPHW